MNYIQYAQQAIPGGLLYMTMPSDNTRVDIKEPITPITYLDKETLTAALRMGMTVEEYLKFLEAQLKGSHSGVVYEDSGNAATNYYRSRTTSKLEDKRAREAAAAERQRLDEAEAKAKENATHALETILAPTLPSTWIGAGTGAMDYKTGEAKDSPEGLLWLDTRLAQDFLFPVAAAGAYRGIRSGIRLADGLARRAYAPYDLYRTIGETKLPLREFTPRYGTYTPRTTVPSKTISFGEVPQGGLLKISFGNRFGESSDFLTNEALDPYSVYILRAKAKGVTDEQLKAIKQFNLHTEEGRKQAAKHIVDKFGLDEGETLENALKNYELLFYEMSIEDGGFGAGMGWNDLEMVHIDPNLRPHKDIPWIIAHETEHALHVPEAPLEQGILDESRLTGELKEYMTGNNNTEVGARISQVLNNAGVTDASTFSGKQLKLLFEQYLASNNMNNEMWSLYKAVKDWDGLAKWANNPKNVYGLAFPLTLGTTYGLTLKKHGGKLNYLNYIS